MDWQDWLIVATFLCLLAIPLIGDDKKSESIPPLKVETKVPLYSTRPIADYEQTTGALTLRKGTKTEEALDSLLSSFNALRMEYQKKLIELDECKKKK